MWARGTDCQCEDGAGRVKDGMSRWHERAG